MMFKKVFAPIAIAVVALAVLLIGCDTPIDPNSMTYGESIPSVGNPSVTAHTWEGIILVSWQPVKDVAKYAIYRRHDNTGDIKNMGVVNLVDADEDKDEGDLPRILDAVSFDNQLINGHSYTYKVIALSGDPNVAFTRAADEDEADPTIAPTYANPGLIWNGEGSATVTANVPNRATYKMREINEADIKIERLDYYASATDKGITGSVADRFLVTWPTQPNAKYTVYYTLGTQSIIDNANDDTSKGIIKKKGSLVINNDTPGFEKPLGYATFPIIAGKSTVTIITEFLNGAYYNSVSSVAKLVDDLAVLHLDTVKLKAILVDDGRSTPNRYVTLKYTEVPGAVSYAIYKAVVDNKGVGDVITTKSDWTAVATTELSRTPTYAKDTTIPVSEVVLRETLDAIDNGDAYVYMIIATGDPAVVPVSQSPTYVTKLVTPEGSDTKIEEDDIQYYFENGDKAKPAYEITITPTAPDETYALTRSALTFQKNGEPKSENIIKIGDPVSVSVPTSNRASALGWAEPIIVHDTGLAARTGYRYTLTITKDGLTTVKTVDKIVTDVAEKDDKPSPNYADPFLLVPPFSKLEVEPRPWVQSTTDESFDYKGEVRVAIEYPENAYLADKPTLTLSYRTTSDSGAGSYGETYRTVNLGKELYYADNQTPTGRLKYYFLAALDQKEKYEFRLSARRSDEVELYQNTDSAATSNKALSDTSYPSQSKITDLGVFADNGQNGFTLTGVEGEFIPGAYDIRYVRVSGAADGTVIRADTSITLARSWATGSAIPNLATYNLANSPSSFAALLPATANVVYNVFIKAPWEKDAEASNLEDEGWHTLGTVTRH
jgi:hypothetical protein